MSMYMDPLQLPRHDINLFCWCRWTVVGMWLPEFLYNFDELMNPGRALCKVTL